MLEETLLASKENVLMLSRDNKVLGILESVLPTVLELEAVLVGVSVELSLVRSEGVLGSVVEDLSANSEILSVEETPASVL